MVPQVRLCFARTRHRVMRLGYWLLAIDYWQEHCTISAPFLHRFPEFSNH
jgi:hypothetical protein